MANITFRLPGREQYSYAEVSVTNEEIAGPEGQVFLTELLTDALAALNLAYPEATRTPAPVAQAAPQAAPQDAIPGGQNCQHGPRKHASGTSAKGPWQALFCQQPKGQQCQAVWLKAGLPGWQW